jgi:uncharacterized protein YkwD
MGRRLRLGLAFVVVAALSALAGALFLAPALSGVQIVVQRVATATAQPQPTPAAGAAIQPSSAPAAPTAPAATASQPTAAAATATPAATVTAPLPTSDPDLDPALALVALLNAERQRAGCDVALALEPRLVQTAQFHAEDMARNDFIDHTGSDGATYSERLDRAGYQYVRRGENIAAAFGAPADVVAMWMDEPPDGPHRTNILNCAYQHAGVGRAERADGYQYWVLDMAEPKQ